MRGISDLIMVENSFDFRPLQENGRDVMVGVERLTTTRLSTTKVINKYQQNQRDQIETKTCSTTTL